MAAPPLRNGTRPPPSFFSKHPCNNPIPPSPLLQWGTLNEVSTQVAYDPGQDRLLEGAPPPETQVGAAAELGACGGGRAKVPTCVPGCGLVRAVEMLKAFGYSALNFGWWVGDCLGSGRITLGWAGLGTV